MNVLPRMLFMPATRGEASPPATELRCQMDRSFHIPHALHIHFIIYLINSYRTFPDLFFFFLQNLGKEAYKLDNTLYILVILKTTLKTHLLNIKPICIKTS